MKRLDDLRFWLCRKAFGLITKPIDYSIKSGDFVTSDNWPYGPLEVLDVNWALRSMAVRLGPDGGVVVWPVWGKKKVH